MPQHVWDNADALFTRESENKWIKRSNLKEEWVVEIAGIQFRISPTDFGHLGIFPEQKPFWEWFKQHIMENCSESPPPKVLNLFAYSGGATLASAIAGAEVCHLDASKGMVAWARQNASLNKLEKAPIRWIIDDVKKFLQREIKRGSFYDAIILDPPTFGRGSRQEIFKIEENIQQLLLLCKQVLQPDPLFLFFSCHTPGFTPITLHHLVKDMMGDKGKIETGEMILSGAPNVPSIPSGSYARWQND